MIITKTPLRISLLGGNTDFPKYFKKYGGAVLTTTIDKYIYCIIKERFDKQIWINYSVKEIVDDVKDIKHDLVREAMKLVGVKDSVEITFLSDIPSEGSGLGSSSAVTVGVLNALHNYKGEAVTARQLAEEACRIEVDILKKPIGYQDQYAVAFGGTNLIEFKARGIDIRTLDVDFQGAFMLFYTGQTRKTTEILSKMKLKKNILDTNKYLAYEGIEAIQKGYFWQLLKKYWELKKQLNPLVSNSLINEKYEHALNAGALAGKIVGAGGGGFLLLEVPENKQREMREVLGLRELPFKISNHGSKVIFDING